MLAELRVVQLGVIENLTVVLHPGMTVLTGETGAGKTLIADAISVLLGGRVDPTVVRPGADEAEVEARFVSNEPDGELVLRRIIPATGRGRAYVDGRMASTNQLADIGRGLVDVHGQNAHQSLLHPAAQRAALDAAAGLRLEEVAQARRALRQLTSLQAGLGGDAQARARELDVLSYQLTELEGAGLDSPTEDADLRDEEALLADAASLRAAAGAAVDGLLGDEGIIDRLGWLLARVSGLAPLSAWHDRLLASQAELSDAASDARRAMESFADNPERLAEIGTRRHVLAELRRKYGGTLAEVIHFREEARTRLADLQDHDGRARRLEAEIQAAEATRAAAEEKVGQARRAAASRFGSEVESALRTLAMPKARFQVEVGADRAGEDVTWLLGANPGEPLQPLAKVASGGELARAMLAVRLVLTERRGRLATSDGRQPGTAGEGPQTLVFDEVDAGIGGEAAVAVGQALAALGRAHQVLAVTHLPQVAACGDRHLVVRKQTKGGRTVATAEEVVGQARVVELSRLLSGRPDSATARRHAEELLAQRAPGRPRHRSDRPSPGVGSPR
jgi:DNA repair protein RecN (Recombination protein N)